MSVIQNTQKLESILNKKSNYICYHAVRERVTMGETLMAHIFVYEKYTDLTTKVLSGVIKMNCLITNI